MSRSLSSVFCDDIRQEVGNKYSYMGCYNGQMYVSTIPFTVLKLCVAMHVVTPAKNPFRELKFRVLKGDAVLAETEINIAELPAPQMPPVDVAGEDLRMSLTQMFQLQPLLVTEPCVILARAFTEEGVVKGGSLVIAHIDQMPTAKTN